MSGFVKVGRVSDFIEGRPRVVWVAGAPVAVFRTPGRWHAVQDRCPHMGASLADGRLDGGRVVCGWHGWEFDLDSGRSERRSGARIRVYEVRIESDEVLLKPPPEPEATPPHDDDDDWVVWDDDKHLKSD